jgi:hypothetical protein
MNPTGLSRASVGVLANVKLIIQKTNDIDKLPIAHTWFNIFSLPDYKNREITRKMVLKALEFSEGFGML